MALVDLDRQTVTLKGFQLLGPADMLTALTALGNLNYRGNIKLDGAVWTLQVQDAQRHQTITAGINDWIILENNAIASAVTQVEFDNLYATQ